ncbi:MAG: hypothetical protein ABSH47_06025 [Bryobacteraceae bacterium]
MKIAVQGIPFGELPGVADARLPLYGLHRAFLFRRPAVFEEHVHGTLDILFVNQQIEVAHAAQAIVAVVPQDQGRAFEHHAFGAHPPEAVYGKPNLNHALTVLLPCCKVRAVGKVNQMAAVRRAPAPVEDGKEATGGQIDFCGIEVGAGLKSTVAFIGVSDAGLEDQVLAGSG